MKADPFWSSGPIKKKLKTEEPPEGGLKVVGERMAPKKKRLNAGCFRRDCKTSWKPPSETQKKKKNVVGGGPLGKRGTLGIKQTEMISSLGVFSPLNGTTVQKLPERDLLGGRGEEEKIRGLDRPMRHWNTCYGDVFTGGGALDTIAQANPRNVEGCEDRGEECQGNGPSGTPSKKVFSEKNEPTSLIRSS